MSAAIQLSLSTVKFLVGDVELQKEAMCWADAVLPSPYLTLSQNWKVPARQDWKKNCGSASQVMNFIQSLTFPWTILLGVQVLPEKGLELSFLL